MDTMYDVFELKLKVLNETPVTLILLAEQYEEVQVAVNSETGDRKIVITKGRNDAVEAAKQFTRSINEKIIETYISADKKSRVFSILVIQPDIAEVKEALIEYVKNYFNEEMTEKLKELSLAKEQFYTVMSSIDSI